MCKSFCLWNKADGLECYHNKCVLILLRTSCCVTCHWHFRAPQCCRELKEWSCISGKMDDGKMGRELNPAPRTKCASRLMGLLFVSASVWIITRATCCLTLCHLHERRRDWEISWYFHTQQQLGSNFSCVWPSFMMKTRASTVNKASPTILMVVCWLHFWGTLFSSVFIKNEELFIYIIIDLCFSCFLKLFLLSVAWCLFNTLVLCWKLNVSPGCH